jgi:hypothetical protein
MLGNCLIFMPEGKFRLMLLQVTTSAGRCKLIVDDPPPGGSLFRIEISLRAGLELLENGQFVLGDGVGAGKLDRMG